MTLTLDKVKLPREAGDWEDVSDGIRSYTQRLKVSGGYVYRTVIDGNVACCFVPGPLSGMDNSPGNSPNVTPAEDTQA